MNDKIRKIMEMNKAGKISDDQAARLLAALSAEDSSPQVTASRQPEQPRQSHQPQLTGTQSGVNSVIRDAFHGLANLPGIISGMLGAKTSVSLAQTTDSGFDFAGVESDTSGNAVYSSDVNGVNLTRAEFCSNTLSATRMHGLEITDGRMANCSVKGAAISNIALSGATMEKSSFTGAHVSGLSIARTAVQHCSFNGSRIDDWQVTDSNLEDCAFNCANLAQIEIQNDCKLRDLSMNGIDGQNILVRQSSFLHVNFNNVDLDSAQFEEANLEHVSFSGHDQSQTLFRRVTLKNVKFRLREGVGNLRRLTMEDMIMKNCNFYNCDFEGSVMRGFTLEDIDCENVDFMDRTIESLDQFLDVIKESKLK